MKKLIVLAALVFAVGCGGEAEENAGVVAEPGTEVPTQTTEQVVQIPAASPAPAGQPSR